MQLISIGDFVDLITVVNEKGIKFIKSKFYSVVLKELNLHGNVSITIQAIGGWFQKLENAGILSSVEMSK